MHRKYASVIESKIGEKPFTSGLGKPVYNVTIFMKTRFDICVDVKSKKFIVVTYGKLNEQEKNI